MERLCINYTNVCVYFACLLPCSSVHVDANKHLTLMFDSIISKSKATKHALCSII